MQKYDIYDYEFIYEESIGEDNPVRKNRPVLLLGNDIFIPVVKITSTLRNNPNVFIIDDWQEIGLSKPSCIDFSRAELANRADLTTYRGHLSQKDIQALKSKKLIEKLNDLEKYQKKHRKKQKGLSPFCYLPDPAKGIDTFNKNMGNDISTNDSSMASENSSGGEAMAENYSNEDTTISKVTAIYIVDDVRKVPLEYPDEESIGMQIEEDLDNRIEVSQSMVNAILSGMKKCNLLFIEPTPKNKSFEKKFNIKTQDDYKQLLNQVTLSDFVEAIKSTYPKYEGDTLLVFQCRNIKLNDIFTNLELYLKFNVDASDRDTLVALSFHELNQFESITELNEAVKSTLSKNYKSKEQINLNDLTQIQLDNQFIKENKSTYKFLSHIREDNENYAWLDKSNLVGVLSLENKSNGKKWIQALEITPQYKGHKLGDQLLQFAIAKGANALSVAKNNEIAIRMYKNNGFISDNKDHGSMLFMYRDKLTESIKPTYTFKYQGPIYRFNRYIEDTKKPIYTDAQNEYHAATMIKGKLKKLLGLSYNSNLDIDEDKVELVNNSNDYSDEIVYNNEQEFDDDSYSSTIDGHDVYFVDGYYYVEGLPNMKFISEDEIFDYFEM